MAPIGMLKRQDEINDLYGKSDFLFLKLQLLNNMPGIKAKIKKKKQKS